MSDGGQNAMKTAEPLASPEPISSSGNHNVLVAEGLTNRQIGERMFLAEKTVKNYVSNLLAKMGMSLVTLGLAGEFGPRGVAVNALWPRTIIATDAFR